MSVTNVSAAVLASPDFTKTTFQDLTPTIYENMDKTAYGMQAVYARAQRARNIGVQPTVLESFLMGSVRDLKAPIKQAAIPSGEFVNLPYSIRVQESNVTDEYFKVTATADTGNTGTTGEQSLTITVLDDTLFDAPTGTPIFNHFLEGQYVYISYKDGTASVGSQTSLNVPFKVVSAVQGANSSIATVVVRPSYTSAGYQALTTAEKAQLKPADGLVTIGVNNVDDYEQYCKQEPVVTAPRYLVDYHQTSRNVVQYTKQYMELQERIANGDINEHYERFDYLPQVDRMRQQEARYRRKWFHSIWENDAINELQSPNAYVEGSTPASLQVLDPVNSDVLGYKANALGIRQLLANDSQIIDFKGGELNLRTVFDACYALKRNREIDGGTVDEIAALTSRQVYDRMLTALNTYIQGRYGIDKLQSYFQAGDVVDSVTGMSLRYIKYDLPEFDFQLVLATDNYFTDRERAMINSGQSSHAGKIWFVDWADLEIGVVKTNQITLVEKDEWAAKVLADLQCTIEQNSITRQLESTTWTTRLGNAKRHLLVEGFNPANCVQIDATDCTSGVPVS